LHQKLPSFIYKKEEPYTSMNIKKHIATIKKTNIRKIAGTDLYQLVIWVSFSADSTPRLLNYEIGSMVQLQDKFKFTEEDFVKGLPGIQLKKCIVNKENEVYSFANFI
jgi:hypothetical protein